MVDPLDDDDLFRHTSMTFGEHLEELRSSLFKAVIALAIGFCIGLFFAGYIVQWIETPLKNALGVFYQDEAVEYVNKRVPEALRNNDAVKRLIYDEQLLPEERYLSARELVSELEEKYPGRFADKVAPAESASGEAPPANHNGKSASKPAAAFSPGDMIRIFAWRPMQDDERLKLDALGVQEPFVIWMKAGFLAGAVISSPFVFYFLWQFVAAGLYPHEKRYIHVFLPFSLGLFLCGAAMAFFLVFPPVLNFFFGIAKSLGSDMRPRLSEWLSFVLLLPLGFGVSFQLPLVMLFLERIHVFSVSAYVAKWRIAVLVIAIAAMVLSPGGDPYSMMMMLIPLVALYFGGIALCKWLPSRRPAAVGKKG
jgi:sec-independent protein translocase protein TatC